MIYFLQFIVTCLRHFLLSKPYLDILFVLLIICLNYLNVWVPPKELVKIPLAPMGNLAHGSAHA